MQHQLRDEWRSQARAHALHPTMTLNDAGLVLGAGTVLAKRRIPSGTSELDLDLTEERILTLLSIAYSRPVDPAVLGNIRRASAAWRDGETVLALIHLAHSALPSLADEDAAYRLFIADRLLVAGVGGRDLLKACGIDTAAFDLLKAGFNPAQPAFRPAIPTAANGLTQAAPLLLTITIRSRRRQRTLKLSSCRMANRFQIRVRILAPCWRRRTPITGKYMPPGEGSKTHPSSSSFLT